MVSMRAVGGDTVRDRQPITGASLDTSKRKDLTMLKTETVINRILTQGEASKLASDYLRRFPIDNELPSKAEIRSWLEGHDQINLFTDRQLPILHSAVELAAAFSHDRLQLREARKRPVRAQL